MTGWLSFHILRYVQAYNLRNIHFYYKKITSYPQDGYVPGSGEAEGRGRRQGGRDLSTWLGHGKMQKQIGSSREQKRLGPSRGETRRNDKGLQEASCG